jgi:cytochrome P450
VFLANPAEIAEVFTTDPGTLHPGVGAAVVEPLVGDTSFMLMEGDAHASGRRTVTPALHQLAVDRHADAVMSATLWEVERWPTDRAFALHPHLRALGLRVVLRLVFGDRAQEQHALHHRLLMMLSIASSPLLPEPSLRRGPGGRLWRRFLSQQAEVTQIVDALIDERTAESEQGSDLLGRLLRARNPDGSAMSRAQVHDNTMTMLVAGHETTAAQLSWAFQLLAYNPVARERLHEEIDSGAGEAYLTATIQEVLRHRCVFLFAIPRAVVEPVEIGGRVYRPPAHLLACIYLLHHDPTIYEDPHAFRPERFLESPPDPRTWIPWGGGRKRCPGLYLAMLEMKTVLRTVLAERTVEPAGRHMERPRWRSVIVTPHAGSRVILRRRVGKR